MKKGNPNYPSVEIYKQIIPDHECTAFLGIRIQMDVSVIKTHYRE